jgi:hypothetical protein
VTASKEPFYVVYPEGGKHLLLQWYTEYDRGHIILAKSESSLLAVARKVFEEHPVAAIKSYSEIDIVSLPPWQIELAAKERFDQKVRSFQWEIACLMHNALAAKRKLPPVFAPCGKYEPEHPELSEREEDSWAVGTHYECKNCLQAIQLVGLTPEEFYAKYHQAWLKANPDHRDNSPRPQSAKAISKASPAGAGGVLYCVRPNFGHHQDGLVISKVSDEPDTSSNDLLSHSHLDGETLFFFRNARELDATVLQAMLDGFRAGFDKSEAEEERANFAKRDKEDRDEIDAAVRFFVETP